MSKVAVKWVDSTFMVGVDSRGQSVTLGSAGNREPHWMGMKPSDLLLLAAGSCSAYDVVVILDKQRTPLAGLEVEITGDQMSEPPYMFTRIHLHYIATGDLDEKKLVKAIELSQEKYCSVIATLRPGVPVSYSYEIRK